MITFIVFCEIIVFAIVIWCVYKFRSVESAFRGGAILSFTGLAASLLLPHFIGGNPPPEALSFLANSGLLVASVGANLIAGSVLARVQS